MNETLVTEAVERLSAGYAHGALEVEELERRLALVHTAKTPAELEALVTDLAPSPTTALVPAQRLRILFGSVERTGPWAVPAQLRARVLCGNLELDLRDARLAAEVTTIEIDVTMGNVEIIVPPGFHVDVDASSFLGNVTERTENTSGAPSSIVRVIGRIKLGNLDVSTLRRGETHRDVRRRRRADRRWRRAQRRILRRAHWHTLREPWD